MFVLTVVLLLPLDLLADFKTIDRRPDDQKAVNTQFEVAFVARDQVPGHAFVTWTKYSAEPWRQLDSYSFGLYPENVKKIVFGTIPGQIRGESLDSIRAASNGLAVRVTEQMYNYALENTKAIRTGTVDYNLIGSSCVDFVELVARALGLQTPPAAGLENHPQAFINALKEGNN